MLDEYPHGGPEFLHQRIYGGSIFQSILYNRVSAYWANWDDMQSVSVCFEIVLPIMIDIDRDCGETIPDSGMCDNAYAEF